MMICRIDGNRGFTLVELMIVVAILAILSAVAIPFYQRYVQKSRLVSLVFPGVHIIETNLATYYSLETAFPQGSTFLLMTEGADTTYFSPSVGSGATVNFVIKGSGATNPLNRLNGQTLIAHPFKLGGEISGWSLSGSLAQSLGMAGAD